MENSEEIQMQIHSALNHLGIIEPGEIAVTVKSGIVTLAGTVTTFDQKDKIEQITLNVNGVKAIINNIVLGDSDKAYDFLIANEANHILIERNTLNIVDLSIQIEEGCITLNGVAASDSERLAAAKYIVGVPHLKGIINNITVKDDGVVVKKEVLNRVLSKHPELKKDAIRVEVSGNRVIIEGNCASLYEKELAERIIRKAPGVKEVYNRIEIPRNNRC